MIVSARPILQFSKWIVTCATCFVAAVLLGSLVPIDGNYRFLFVQSGSMEPKVPVGSLVMIVPQVQYSIGDVVTFAPSLKEPEKLVTHRLTGFADEAVGLLYQTKGDANKTADPMPLPGEQIVGKVVFGLPFVGYLLNLLRTPQGFILAVVVPATILIYEEIKKLYQGFRDGVKNVMSKKQSSSLGWSSQEQSLLQNVETLRSEREITLSTPLSMLILVFGLGFAFVGITHGFFSDTERGSANFVAAAIIPSPGSSPRPSPTGSPTAGHIVINEVFYDVDGAHGKDSPGDRGVQIGELTTRVRISGNGAGSQNSAFVDIETLCSVVQTNQTDVDISIDISGNTGGNTGFGNVINNLTIESGNVSNALVIDIQGGNNTLSNFCQGSDSRNHEWIELYNPTTQPVNIKNWTITDNSGISVTIPGNRTIDPGKFVLTSKSNSTWSYWNEPNGTMKIPLGRQIGDGLDDEGDRLILKDKNGIVVDQLSFGDDNSVFSLSDIAEGHSYERDPDGLDTDTASDLVDRPTPMPGS